jgi:hypothetical protein
MNDLLARAARLVAVAHTRFPGKVEHHFSCGAIKPPQGCDCGANELNEALNIITKLYGQVGNKWVPTEAALQAEIDALNEVWQARDPKWTPDPKE